MERCDVSVERHPSGVLTLYAMHPTRGYLVTRRFVDYSTDEAMEIFIEECALSELP